MINCFTKDCFFKEKKKKIPGFLKDGENVTSTRSLDIFLPSLDREHLSATGHRDVAQVETMVE
jgi:hypothetical protein